MTQAKTERQDGADDINQGQRALPVDRARTCSPVCLADFREGIETAVLVELRLLAALRSHGLDNADARQEKRNDDDPDNDSKDNDHDWLK